MTYVFESGKYDNYYKINYKYDFGIVSLSDDYIGRLNEDILIMKQPKAGNLYDGSPAFCFHKNSV